MKRELIGAVALLGLSVTAIDSSLANDRNTGRGTGPVVYVQSQDLFYDSIVLASLPANGPFQELLIGVGPSGLATEFGPGDVGYYAGRWWVDVNGNGEMDGDDDYFLCPLLGPGRSDP